MPKSKKIDLFSFTKLHTLIGALAGLILGIIYSFGGLIIDTLVTLGWITSQETPGLSQGTLLAFGALIGMPAIFAIFGFIVGIIGAILYNLFSKFLPEIDLDIKK
jgi:hypothetical protein